MSQRQRILIMYLSTACLASETTAWAEYDGTGTHPYTGAMETEPPYWSVLDAMKDGWRVIQFPSDQAATSENAYRTGPFPFEFILEKLEDAA